MDRAAHWDRVYASKEDLDVSWFEPEPSVSLALPEAAGLKASSRIIDIGGGNSRLVDALLARDVAAISVLDVSSAAIERVRARLGDIGTRVNWIVGDVAADLDVPAVDLWHDRAVFHFLTEPDDRAGYLRNLERAVVPGGSAVIATFAVDGPARCSGLPVVRYSPETLAVTLGPRFRRVESVAHVHHTPWGATQSFQYSRFNRLA